jgi:hypothetical protein
MLINVVVIDAVAVVDDEAVVGVVAEIVWTSFLNVKMKDSKRQIIKYQNLD